ncbi:MAG: ATP-dependent sacrificial sulfur transferase LarE [Pseudodesulfovibrio sp.]|nr:ATP-dependent sacrificial sulfur transferase LarE [Pseudodesulfovibrio sp.]
MDKKGLSTRISVRASGYNPVVVCLSGGVDSALVASAAHDVLGNRVMAVTVHSELIADRDFTRAVEIAEHIGIEHHPLLVRALDDEFVCQNTEDRCYHCKKGIFRLMALEYGDACVILDGTNADDDPSRPGLCAVREFGVYSPLLDAGLGKSEVRTLACAAGLPNWDTPSESCLATRILAGMPLSKLGLSQVQDMETFFHLQGVQTLRASHDNLMATVTYLPEAADIMVKSSDKFAALIERIGLRSYRIKEWTG